MEPSYTYRAIVKSIYDGDTIRVDIDCGFNVWQTNVPVRLKGINAPEVTGVERTQGLMARGWLIMQIPIGTRIVLKTEKDAQEKYGRWLGTIFLNDVNINEQMVAEGFAKPYM